MSTDARATQRDQPCRARAPLFFLPSHCERGTAPSRIFSGVRCRRPVIRRTTQAYPHAKSGGTAQSSKRKEINTPQKPLLRKDGLLSAEDSKDDKRNPGHFSISGRQRHSIAYNRDGGDLHTLAGEDLMAEAAGTIIECTGHVHSGMQPTRKMPIAAATTSYAHHIQPLSKKQVGARNMSTRILMHAPWREITQPPPNTRHWSLIKWCINNNFPFCNTTEYTVHTRQHGRATLICHCQGIDRYMRNHRSRQVVATTICSSTWLPKQNGYPEPLASKHYHRLMDQSQMENTSQSCLVTLWGG
ncbi:uncharacterized protein TEOVI_000091600 [Trypanosoma equiperdum]|uniref:Uncharacterized protein n=1 Tax=Trypanosoma equiperdum TaxID=5694 RepID=A0A1G4IBA8_TRYEQ|nr:hypothetical protein TEOVI_000091600 [Trypanosoma equiperdum]